MPINEILVVHVVKGVPGDRWLTCPHCREAVFLPSGPVRGETFQHKSCGGWLEVSPEARLTSRE